MRGHSEVNRISLRPIGASTHGSNFSHCSRAIIHSDPQLKDVGVPTKLKSVFITYPYSIQKKDAKCEYKKVELEIPTKLHFYSFLPLTPPVRV